DISNAIIGILGEILANGVVTNKDIPLREANRGIILRDVGTKAENAVLSLKQFYDLDQAKALIQNSNHPLLKRLNANSRRLTMAFAERLLQPNITLNRSETEERKKKVAKEIDPILYKVKAGEMILREGAGEMILREGERVSDLQLQKLKTLQAYMKKERLLSSSTGVAMMIICLLFTGYILHYNFSSRANKNNKDLTFIASVLITFFFFGKISIMLADLLTKSSPLSITAPSMYFGIPMASSAMIICLFLGRRLAIVFAIVFSICTALMFQNRYEMLVYFLLTCIMAVHWTHNFRERKDFIKAGIKLGLLSIVFATAVGFLMPGFSLINMMWSWVFALIGGICVGILTAGLAPLVEVAFDYTTDIKLLELANLDQPILRKLMLEAPGTYHHSVIIGTMVEAAASEISENPLLAKVCGYYHDIGKTNKPLYFVENQRDSKNRHDKLAPSMSKHILISHVKEGVEIAKKNKLGQAIIDTIQQHHGTSTISFFYEKAKKQLEEDKIKRAKKTKSKLLKAETPINMDDFRYPGPKPQNRIAGLVMLADIVEAASRTLENPTHPKLQGVVQNMFNKVFSDGQLEDCELTLKDLNNIAKSFIIILSGIYHHRIEYAEPPTANNGKNKNGSSDKQPAKKAQDIQEKNAENGAGHLKRLGLS
ncbi:MAG: HDIG domain-containing protein, partial [Deltaproteobacteria bacterium]|nr:HDIG domain-containing protein [Deltaproteobacteria bacterium]